MKKLIKLSLNIFVTVCTFITLGACDLISQHISTTPVEKSYNTIAELYQDAELGDMVSISATVSTIFDNGYILYDGVNYLGVYGNNLLETAIGKVIKVKGEYSQYQTLFQIYPTSEELLDEVGVELPKAQPIDRAGIEAITNAKEECGKLYNMTVTLAWENNGTYDNIELYMDGNRVGRVYFSSHVESYNALKVYAEAGKTVNIDLVFYANHSQDGKLFMFYGNNIKEIQ